MTAGFDLARAGTASGRGPELQFRDDDGRHVRIKRPQPFTYMDPNGATTVPANSSRRVNIRFKSDGGFVWSSTCILATSLSGLDVRIIDEDAQRELMDQQIPANLIASNNARFPYRLARPTYLRPHQVLGFDLFDTSGVDNEVFIVLRGYKLLLADPDVGQIDVVGASSRTVYWHRFDLTLAAAIGATNSDTVTVQEGAPFEWREFQATVRDGYDVDIAAASGGWRYSNRRIPAELLAGDGERPGLLHAPERLPRKEDVVITGTNRTAGAITVKGCLGGSRLWKDS